MRFTSQPFKVGSVLHNPNFRWLAGGSGLNSAGMQGEQVVIGYMIYRLTESSYWVGLSLALFFAPMLLVGIPAGVLADRYDRRKLLIWAEVGLTTLLAIFALYLAMTAATVGAALVISLLSGTLRSLHHPARLSYTGDIAGQNQLVSAVSMMSVVTRLGQLAGAVAAGFVGQWLGAAFAYSVLAFGHLVALLCFLRTQSNSVTKTEHHTDPKASLFSSLKEYAVLMRTSSIFLTLILLASAIEIFGFSFVTALPELAVERLGVSDGGLGAMHAARAIGGLAGALLLSAIVIQRIGVLYCCIMALFGFALIGLALTSQISTVLLTIAFIAVFASSADILVISMLQICVPEHLKGRAMGAWVFALGMGPIGHLELGILMTLLGTTLALTINGTVLIVVGLGVLATMRIVRDFSN